MSFAAFRRGRKALFSEGTDLKIIARWQWRSDRVADGAVARSGT